MAPKSKQPKAVEPFSTGLFSGFFDQTCMLAPPEASKREAPTAEAGGPPMKRPACSKKPAASSSVMPPASDAEARPSALHVVMPKNFFRVSLVAKVLVECRGSARRFRSNRKGRGRTVPHKDSSAVSGNKG